MGVTPDDFVKQFKDRFGSRVWAVSFGDDDLSLSGDVQWVPTEVPGEVSLQVWPSEHNNFFFTIKTADVVMSEDQWEFTTDGRKWAFRNDREDVRHP